MGLKRGIFKVIFGPLVQKPPHCIHFTTGSAENTIYTKLTRFKRGIQSTDVIIVVTLEDDDFT